MGKLYMGIPREKIPWFPKINKDKCSGCLTCVNFCRNGVYIVEENSNLDSASTSKWDKLKKRPKVENPFNCVVGCSACAQLCPMEAIEFPERKKIVKTIWELASKYQGK
ncbi:4Fe-4S binding protein [Candidatus Bathyarchaeota archaeon]|nr:4Fe-4S binding protein [Candidatus Bathyarchaeota archaeon]